MRGRSRALLPGTVTHVGATMFAKHFPGSLAPATNGFRASSKISHPIIPKAHLELKRGEMFSPSAAKFQIEWLREEKRSASELWLSLTLIPDLPIYPDMVSDCVYLFENGYIRDLKATYKHTLVTFDELRNLYSEDSEVLPTGCLKLLDGEIVSHEEVVRAYKKLLYLKHLHPQALELLILLCFDNLYRYKESDLRELVKGAFVEATGCVKNGEYEGDYAVKRIYHSLLKSGAEARCPFYIIPNAKMHTQKLNSVATAQMNEDVRSKCRKIGF